MAATSLADLSDAEFVEECCKALWALHVAIVQYQQVNGKRPYDPDASYTAFTVIQGRCQCVRGFATSRLYGVATRNGITFTANWKLDFINDFSDSQLHDMNHLDRYDNSVVIPRYRAILDLEDIIKLDQACPINNPVAEQAEPQQQADALPAKPKTTKELEQTDTILPVLICASDIAKHIRQNVKSVTSFLTRFAEKKPDCRVANDSKRKNEPAYLYRTADVWPALQARKSSNAKE